MPTDWLVIGFFLLAALIVYLFLQISQLRRQVGQQTDQLHKQMKSQQVSINGLTAGAVGVDNRLSALKVREKELEQRQSTFESQQEIERPYGEAIRLVQQGASTRRLMDELDLSESEAELIVMLHGDHEST